VSFNRGDLNSLLEEDEFFNTDSSTNIIPPTFNTNNFELTTPLNTINTDHYVKEEFALHVKEEFALLNPNSTAFSTDKTLENTIIKNGTTPSTDQFFTTPSTNIIPPTFNTNNFELTIPLSTISTAHYFKKGFALLNPNSTAFSTDKTLENTIIKNGTTPSTDQFFTTPSMNINPNSTAFSTYETLENTIIKNGTTSKSKRKHSSEEEEGLRRAIKRAKKKEAGRRWRENKKTEMENLQQANKDLTNKIDQLNLVNQGLSQERDYWKNIAICGYYYNLFTSQTPNQPPCINSNTFETTNSQPPTQSTTFNLINSQNHLFFGSIPGGTSTKPPGSVKPSGSVKPFNNF